MLDKLFMQILDMTAQASVVILVVMLARLLLKRAPKVFSYMLWVVVLFRLVCPVSIEAPVSVVPEFESVSDSYTLEDQTITILDAGAAAYQAVGDALNGGLDFQQVYINEVDEFGFQKTVTVSWWEVWILFGQYVWLAGIGGLLIYSVVTYLRLRGKLIGATPLHGNIYLADHIDSPFVLGLIRPKIYLPSTLSQQERGYIIAHEQYHIRRRDHLVKLIAFLALALHWFNPLVWIAYILFCKDMEMSCDEAVIKKLGEDIRADYSASLLNLATGRRIIAITPLAFGEGDTKGRIKNLASWKKPLLWVIVVSVTVCIAVAVCLLTDPVGSCYSTIQRITKQRGYSIIDQCRQEITLSISSADLPEGIYSEQGYEFPDGEIVAYQDDTTTIYLKGARYSNEGTENLYFWFEFLYDLPRDGGKVIYPLEIKEDGYTYDPSVKDGILRTEKESYPDAVHFRGQDSDKRMWFYVSTDALKQIEGTFTFDIRINQITYLKDGAQLPIGAPAPEITELSSETDGSGYRLKAYLPKTDFSKLGQTLVSEVAAEWDLFDSLTQQQQHLSSHLWGAVYMEADTWEECERDIGLTVENPLDSMAWLTDTAYFGGYSTDPRTPHVKATVYATHASDRQVSQINICTGYISGDIPVSLTAVVHRDDSTYTTGAVRTGYVTFDTDKAITGTGISVLVMTPNDNADYCSVDAYWTKDNVFYSLHLVAERGKTAEVRAELERILAQI